MLRNWGPCILKDQFQFDDYINDEYKSPSKMTVCNYFIWNIQRLQDMMFCGKKKHDSKTLHAQMLPCFLYLLGPFILKIQPRDCAKYWSLGLASVVLLSSLFIRHLTYVNEHSFYSVHITHHVQRISPPCTLYLLGFFCLFYASYTTIEARL